MTANCLIELYEYNNTINSGAQKKTAATSCFNLLTVTKNKEISEISFLDQF